MQHEIYIIDDDETAAYILNDLFSNEKEYVFKSVTTEEIDVALRNIPTLIIINEDSIQRDIVELCKKIRQNEDNSITPIIVASSDNDKKHRIETMKANVEYYIRKPVDEEYLYYTIKNLIRLIYTNRKISPLTGLPGNVQIQAEIRKRMLNKEEFGVLYFDLDNFKAYNDYYGFLKGDEMIKFTARTILNNVHKAKCKNSFVGHIGGDDFVAVISEIDYDSICEDIIKEFDKEVCKYFNLLDIEKGYLEILNRKGIIEQFPLTTISIGVVHCEKGRFHNVLEIGEVGAQVKHLAKARLGSTYVVDRRK